ncbi:hypothetical protein A6A04_08175 [Paramagnetospirillum marisnigri]|uniref:DUF3572 domain-containing protein n=1 Tax=Paramagnetospirillum marisnigri TaxID=1285242 RepID=A0A178M9X3_9PROT|nr:hypothetical protein A6A04_08175 [Paramagnetospirillum marisnigri]
MGVTAKQGSAPQGGAATQAEIVALRALAWLMSDEDRALRFLTASGCDATSLRRRANDPLLLGSVLDVIMEDEASLIEFSAWADLEPAAAARARRLLPGAWSESQLP